MWRSLGHLNHQPLILLQRVGEDKTSRVGYFFHMLVIDTSFSRYSGDLSTVPAWTFAGPGHEHNDKEKQAESVKCINVRNKSNTVVHHRKLQKSQPVRQYQSHQ